MENENMEMVNVDTTAEVENESSTGKNIAIIGLGAALLGAAAYGVYKLGAVVKNKIENARRLKKAVKDAEEERKAAETADVTVEN